MIVLYSYKLVVNFFPLYDHVQSFFLPITLHKIFKSKIVTAQKNPLLEFLSLGGQAVKEFDDFAVILWLLLKGSP